MLSAPPKWTTLVLVCDNERPEGAPKPSCRPQGGGELREWLKSELKREGLWGKVRVLSTSCLDLCTHGVTVALDGGAERLVVDPKEDREALLARIRAQVAVGPAA